MAKQMKGPSQKSVLTEATNHTSSAATGVFHHRDESIDFYHHGNSISTDQTAADLYCLYAKGYDDTLIKA